MRNNKDTALNGVLTYIQLHYSHITPNYKEFGQLVSFVSKLQREFLTGIGVKYVKNKEYIETQKNWKQFKEFLKSK